MTEELTQRPAAQTEREAFEEWYAEDANKQTGKPGWFTPKSIAELRDGDGYGEHRVMLNGKWEGWQARASLQAQQSTQWATPTPTEHIKEPYTLAELNALVASHEYNAELLLQHALLLLNAQPAEVSDAEIVDWFCEEAQHTCGQWQVVIESNNPSFIEAVREHAARAHGITAPAGQPKE